MNRLIPLLALAAASAVAGADNQGSLQGTPGGGFTYGNARSYAPAPVFAPLPLMTVDPAAAATPEPAGLTVLTFLPGMGPSTLAPIDPMNVLSGIYLASAPVGQNAPEVATVPVTEGDYPPGTVRIVAPDEVATTQETPVQEPAAIVQPEVAQAANPYPLEDLRPPIAYEPVYAPTPVYVPQTVYVESAPQVIVQQEYIPYPVWEPVLLRRPCDLGFGISICFSDGDHDRFDRRGFGDHRPPRGGVDAHPTPPAPPAPPRPPRPPTATPARPTLVTNPPVRENPNPPSIRDPRDRPPIAALNRTGATPPAPARWVENARQGEVPVISAVTAPTVSGPAPVKAPAPPALSAQPRANPRTNAIPTLKSSKPVEPAPPATIVRHEERPPVAPVVMAPPPGASKPLTLPAAAPVVLHAAPAPRFDPPAPRPEAPVIRVAPAPRSVTAAPRISAPEPLRIATTPSPAPVIRAAAPNPAPAIRGGGNGPSKMPGLGGNPDKNGRGR